MQRLCGCKQQQEAMEFFGSSSDDEDSNSAVDDLLAACMRLVPPLAGVRPALQLSAGCASHAVAAAAAGFEIVEAACAPNWIFAACDLLMVADQREANYLCVAPGEATLSCIARGVVVAALKELDLPGWEVVWTNNQTAVYRRLYAVDRVGCPPRPPADAAEAARCAKLVITTRRAAGPLPLEAYVDRAARVLAAEGLVILPGLLDAADADALCTDALDDFESCRQALLKRGGGDLAAAGCDSQNYRELALREDLRCDLRGTPKLGGKDGASRRDLLKGNAAVREICRRAATAPASQNREGNYGLWNFDLGGPRAPKKLLDAGAIGSVVALPGCTEQALHADAPHVFDGVHLPGHYFNCFLAGGDATREPQAGQTAFVPRSHFCDVCADLVKGDRDAHVARNLVRPRLSAGDAVVFDARILHFGLPNRSRVRRALVYCNHTEYWFRDPKNWDDQVPVFG